MKIEAGKKYRVKTRENSRGVWFGFKVGEIVTAEGASPYSEESFMGIGLDGIDQSIPIECVEGIDDIYAVAENLWQTLCAVKQALDSGQEIDKEYIAKVLAENRPEEKE